MEGIWFDFPSWDKDTETLWALPNGGTEIKHQLVARGDWLDAVGAAVPTTVEEFAEVARKFTFDDPDGDGEKNTWGIATSATSPGSWTSSLRTFLAAFGYEHIERPYLDPDSGEITFFEVSEGFRDFLRWMNGMWEAGVIHPDVTLPNKQAVGTLFQDGHVGFAGDSWTWVLPTYRPGTWFPNLFEKDPDARVEYLGQLTAAGHQPTWELRPALWMYHTVGKDTSDLVLEKILGVIELQMADPFYHNLIWSGIEGEHFEFDDGGMRQFVPGMSLEAQGDLGVKFFLTNIRYGWMFTASFAARPRRWRRARRATTSSPRRSATAGCWRARTSTAPTWRGCAKSTCGRRSPATPTPTATGTPTSHSGCAPAAKPCSRRHAPSTPRCSIDPFRPPETAPPQAATASGAGRAARSERTRYPGRLTLRVAGAGRLNRGPAADYSLRTATPMRQRRRAVVICEPACVRAHGGVSECPLNG